MYTYTYIYIEREPDVYGNVGAMHKYILTSIDNYIYTQTHAPPVYISLDI